MDPLYLVVVGAQGAPGVVQVAPRPVNESASRAGRPGGAGRRL